MNTWQRLCWRDRFDREIDRELRFHVEEETKRLVADGLPPDTARQRALASFGGIEPIKESVRDVWRTRWLEDAGSDIRYAVRTMRRHPAFTIAAVLSLAIGIGANTAIYDVLHALLLRPLSVAAPRELWYLTRTGPAADALRFDARGRIPFAAIPRYGEALHPFGGQVAAMSAAARMQLTAAEGDPGAELALGQLVTGNWFSVVGITPQVGRLFTDADDAAIGGAPVAVISDAYWTRRFARDPSVVGTTVRVNRYPVAIVGVAAPRFEGFLVGSPMDIWVPTGLQQ